MPTDPIAIVAVGMAALITILGGLFGIAVAIKTLFFPKIEIDPDKEFVTRKELATTVGEFEKKLDTLRSDIATKLDKQNDYARVTAHEHLNIMNQIGLKVERLLAMREFEETRKPRRSQNEGGNNAQDSPG